MSRHTPKVEAKQVSVALELAELEKVVELQVHILEQGPNAEADDAWRAKRTAAVLALVATRLRDLHRTIRGSLEVKALWREATATEPHDHDDPDLVLVQQLDTKSRR